MILARGPALIMTMIAAASAVPGQRTAPALPAPTQVLRFAVPSTLPLGGVAGGDCAAPSTVAGYRRDAVRCTVGAQVFDPCFLTPRADRVLCNADPVYASRGLVFALATPLAPPPPEPERPISGVHFWFFELSDGSACRPVSGTRRDVGGLTEIYTCLFAMPGTADAVLGDLDTTQPVWTIQQVLINKKIEPPTLKSTIVVAVKAVWQ